MIKPDARTTSKAALVLGGLLALAGVIVLLIPCYNRIKQTAQAKGEVSSFLSYRQAVVETTHQPATEPLEPDQNTEPTEVPTPHEQLLEAMRSYNQQIYATKQIGLSDPWCYSEPVIDLPAYGLKSEAVGVLTIPKMELEEPIYLGATPEHLANGVAQLSISSMPIGGENTNCVLAGHRGWHGALHFRHIELLELGDTVTLSNLWEDLTYKVVDIKVIEPWQPEQLLIQEGRDLLTLMTCHPYGSHGRYRLAVFCERIR